MSLSEKDIIIVDDVPSARRVVRRMLERIGLNNIREASDGEEALKLLERSPAQLVISDWDMPKLDGLGLLAQMRERSDFDQIPFIMITSTVERGEVENALTQGVAQYIVKPFSFELLREKVKGVLS